MPTKTLYREELRLSPCVGLVRKGVKFHPDRRVGVYLSLAQPDYMAILGRTRRGMIPIVQQFRPAVKACTWGLPAGLLEEGEAPEDGCRRELKEESGLVTEAITCLGGFYTDTGRLENCLHVFFAGATNLDPTFVPEPNISVRFVTGSAVLRGLEWDREEWVQLRGVSC